MCQFLASKLIQPVIPTESITNLNTGLYFCAKMCHFLASKLIQHSKAVGSIRNFDTGSYFCHEMCLFSSIMQQLFCQSEILIHGCYDYVNPKHVSMGTLLSKICLQTIIKAYLLLQDLKLQYHMFCNIYDHPINSSMKISLESLRLN